MTPFPLIELIHVWYVLRLFFHQESITPLTAIAICMAFSIMIQFPSSVRTESQTVTLNVLNQLPPNIIQQIEPRDTRAVNDYEYMKGAPISPKNEHLPPSSPSYDYVLCPAYVPADTDLNAEEYMKSTPTSPKNEHLPPGSPSYDYVLCPAYVSADTDLNAEDLCESDNK